MFPYCTLLTNTERDILASLLAAFAVTVILFIVPGIAVVEIVAFLTGYLLEPICCPDEFTEVIMFLASEANVQSIPPNFVV